MEEKIFEEYSSMVYKIAYGYTRKPEDTDDVFQEVFLTYFKKNRRFESEEHRKAWFIRVTINAAKDHLKKRGKYVALEEAAQDSLHYNDKTDEGDIMQAIEQLDDTSRDIIYMFYYEDMSVKAIAQALEINASTVTTRLSRAREKLSYILKDYK